MAGDTTDGEVLSGWIIQTPLHHVYQRMVEFPKQKSSEQDNNVLSCFLCVFFTLLCLFKVFLDGLF